MKAVFHFLKSDAISRYLATPDRWVCLLFVAQICHSFLGHHCASMPQCLSTAQAMWLLIVATWLFLTICCEGAGCQWDDGGGLDQHAPDKLAGWPTPQIEVFGLLVVKCRKTL